MIDIDENHLAEVRRILEAHVPGVEVRAYGSRVSGGSGRNSDLDLAVAGEGETDWRTIESLKEAFAVSDLPFSVDVLDLHAVPEHIREEIERDYVIIKEK